MIVGICVIHIHLSHPQSLKEKRRVIKSLKTRIKGKFNVSIAEVGALDKWQRAVLGICTVSNDKRFVNEVLDKVLGMISRHPEVEIVDHRLEFV